MILANYQPTLRKFLASNLEGIGDISQGEIWMLAEMSRQITGGCFQGCLGFGRKEQGLPGPRRSFWCWRLAWRFLQKNMCIGPAQTERTHTGSQRPCMLPIAQDCIDIKRTLLKIQPGIWPGKVQTGRKLTMFESKDNFNQPGHTSCGIEMTQICLYRAERTEACLLCTGAKSLSQSGYLNGVSENCPCAMCLNIT